MGIFHHLFSKNGMVATWWLLILASSLIKITNAAWDDLTCGLKEADHIKRSEGDRARQRHAKHSGTALDDGDDDEHGEDTASRLVNSFLQSTPEAKRLSECALGVQCAVKCCRRRYSHLSCSSFWDLVQRGAICKGLGLSKKRKHKQTPHHCPSTECPFSEPDCTQHNPRYRTIDGTCNNERNPLWGSTNRALNRWLQPDYFDCLSAPRDAPWGLPSTREVSNRILQADVQPPSTVLTLMHMTYGQIIDHDMDLTPVAKLQDPDTGELVDVDCGPDGCDTEGEDRRNCFPIPVPPGDPLFGSRDCHPFVRSEETLLDDCSPSPRQQINVISSWLDCGFIYGSSQNKSDSLRTHVDGQLRSMPHPFSASFLPLLPGVPKNKDCRNTTDVIQCFITGDVRENEQVGLTALHTSFMRYHNYVATNLKSGHPDWNDETLFQEARRVVTAVFVHTVYNEYLPPLLGDDIMRAFQLYPEISGYMPSSVSYRLRTNPDTPNVFSTAAFRFGHSQIPDHLRFSDPSLQHHEDVFYTEVFFNPNRLYKSNILGNTVSGVNAVLIGMTDQKAAASDSAFTGQVAGSLFTNRPPFGQGTDLPARNTQRGREHGIPGYVGWLSFCHQVYSQNDLPSYQPPQVRDFDDLRHLMRQHKIDTLKALYVHVEDIDLFPGAMLEEHVPGGVVGPTFACLIAKQFQAVKFGDKFFYEANDSNLRFTLDQLASIRQQTVSSILCETMEDEPGHPTRQLNFQKRVMLQRRADAEQALSGVSAAERDAKLLHYNGKDNERVPCAQLPSLDMSLF